MESVKATTVEEDGNHIQNGHVESDSKQKEGDLGSEETSPLSQPLDRSGLRETTPENGYADGGDSDMEIEDLNEIPPSADSSFGLENGEIRDDCVHTPTVLQVNSEAVVVAETLNSTVGGEVGCAGVQHEISIERKKMKHNSISGMKRPRLMFDEGHPSVLVKYNSLTRSSKLKLEELLHQWSEWHTQHALSAQDPDEPLESGEETFSPALHIHTEKASSLTFWMDQQTAGNQQSNEFIPLDHKSVPLYDRGFALGLTSDDGTSSVERGLKIVGDDARCFNCGSYSHALKECTQPRDHRAVNNARKERNLKKNQNSGSRNQARYYQNSPSGKYDGLRPGVLDAETRKLLGLGELDPPPWLSRMRELGYPPGYLDPDEEDQPSGITIFEDFEPKPEQEDGEIIEAEIPEPDRKMSVEFPGINGPIPKNANERLWLASTPPSLDISRSRLLRRSSSSSSSHSSEPNSRSAHHREERWSRSDFREDGPPGVDPGVDPAISTHLPRYSTSSYDSHTLRFESDRVRRSRFHDEGSSPYSTRLSPLDYGSSRHRNQADESRDRLGFDHSTRSSSRERQERYRHLTRW